MPKQRISVNAGDVLELKVDNRYAYLHFIGKHHTYGDAVLVNSKLNDRQIPVTAGYFAHAYLTFYPINLAVAEGLVDIVAHLPPPDLPKKYRRAGAMHGRCVTTWIRRVAATDRVHMEP